MSQLDRRHVGGCRSQDAFAGPHAHRSSRPPQRQHHHQQQQPNCEDHGSARHQPRSRRRHRSHARAFAWAVYLFMSILLCPRVFLYSLIASQLPCGCCRHLTGTIPRPAIPMTATMTLRVQQNPAQPLRAPVLSSLLPSPRSYPSHTSCFFLCYFTVCSETSISLTTCRWHAVR
jgi:hypothetical protein